MLTQRDAHERPLDFLRCLALLLVMVGHINMALSIRPLFIGHYDISVHFLKLWIGVEIFFVLSGFLITRQLFLKAPQLTFYSAKIFLSRRIFRTWPAYFAVVLFLTFVLPANSNFFHLVGHPNDQGTFLQLAREFTFTTNFLGGSILPVAWSLCVEEHYYFLLPLLLAIGAWSHRQLGSISPALVVGLLLVAQLALRFYVYLQYRNEIGNYELFCKIFYMPTYMHIDGLTLGSFLGYWEAKNPHWIVMRKSRLSLVFAPIFLLGAAFLYRFGFGAINFYSCVPMFLVCAITFTSLLILLRTLPVISTCSLVNYRVWTMLATRTYSIYLTHELALAITGGLVTRQLNELLFPVSLWCRLSFSARYTFR
jgi:peptidoglycan/LPS O-acetylase OafA/YrhL